MIFVYCSDDPWLTILPLGKSLWVVKYDLFIHI